MSGSGLGPLGRAHPLTGYDGLYYCKDGSDFGGPLPNGSVGGPFREVVTAKIGPAGAAALQEFLEQRGYWLPTPEEFPARIAGKPILFWWFPGHAWKRIVPEELAEVLRPYALTEEQCRTENLIFGVIYWQFGNIRIIPNPRRRQ